MVDKLLKDINEDGGKTKIHIDEIADSMGVLLGDLTGWDMGNNASGKWFKHPSGLLICYHVSPTYRGFKGGVISETSIEFYNHILPFPVEFVGDLPAVVPIGLRQAAAQWAGIRGITLNHVDLYVFGSGVDIRSYPGYIAIGSWK